VAVTSAFPSHRARRSSSVDERVSGGPRGLLESIMAGWSGAVFIREPGFINADVLGRVDHRDGFLVNHWQRIPERAPRCRGCRRCANLAAQLGKEIRRS
jgi:hypothetical protein